MQGPRNDVGWRSRSAQFHSTKEVGATLQVLYCTCTDRMNSGSIRGSGYRGGKSEGSETHHAQQRLKTVATAPSSLGLWPEKCITSELRDSVTVQIQYIAWILWGYLGALCRRRSELLRGLACIKAMLVLVLYSSGSTFVLTECSLYHRF
jgi:hypothetical protein